MGRLVFVTLRQSVLGPFIVRRRTPKVEECYKSMGGASPIRMWTEKQVRVLGCPSR